MIGLALDHWYLVIVLLLVVTVKTPWFKGVMGELKVKVLMRFFLNKDDYQVIHDVTLPTEDGTTQIDHIVVSKFGVFIVETKNMKGLIFGTARQKQWTQVIYKYKGKFQNPMHQNYKHTKTFTRLTGIDESLVYPVVTFVGDSTFKTKMPESVTTAYSLIRYIKSKRETVFTAAQQQQIIDTVHELMLERGFKTNRAHRKHVKKIIAAKR